MKLSREFRQRCEKIAAEQRGLLNLAPYAPLRGEALAEWHGLTVCEPRDPPGMTDEAARDYAGQTGWDGVLLPNPPNHGPIILLRPGVSLGRRQATLMHEIAHLLLGHDPLRWDLSLGQWEARRDADEAEATYLGGCLQIPRVGLRWATQVGLSVARTASHFGASEDMVRYRANVTGVRLPR